MRGLEFPGSSLRGAGVFQRRWEREMPGVFGYFFLPFFHFLAAWIRSRWDPAASAALISAFIWEPFFFLGRARIRSLPKNLGIAGWGIIPVSAGSFPALPAGIVPLEKAPPPRRPVFVHR